LRSEPRLQAQVFQQLGFCFVEKNNWRLAERNFEDALKHVAASDEATRKELLFQIASGSAKTGDYAKAIEFGCDLANVDFAYRDIGKLLDSWQEKMARTSGAVQT
jgi:Tfp pilus assembly protein PilF